MSIRILLLAVTVIGGASLLWISQNAQAPAATAEIVAPKAAKILVAIQPIQAGTLLKDTDLKERDLAPGEASESLFIANDDSRTEIRGAMLRRYLDTGESLVRQDILRPKDRGFLAAVLSPGTRAVSIAVDATTGAAGLISPGDLVDVILSQEFARGETSLARRVVAETVLNMVRVIAVDQQIAQGAPTGAPVVGTANSRVASTISLQVTPEQAAKVVVAERLGKLTLTIRSIDSDAAGKPIVAASAAPGHDRPTGSVFGADVSAALTRDEPAISPKLRLIQGDSVSDVVFR